MKEVIKKAIYIYIYILLAGCVVAFQSIGIPKQDYKEEVYRANHSYKVNISNYKASFRDGIGSCGSELYLFMLVIPIPKIQTSCNEITFSYVVLGEEDNIIDFSRTYVLLKFNDEIVEPSFVLYGTFLATSRPIFKISDGETFKDSKNKSIIIKVDGNIIGEVPFDYGIQFRFYPFNS